MKIVFIDPQSYSNLALYDYNLLRMINNEISFFGSYLFDQPIPQNVTFYPYFKYNKKKAILKPISYVISLFKIMRHVLRIHPQVIHIQWIRLYYVDYLFLRWLISRNIKVVYTAHNVLPHNDFEKKRYYNIFKKYYNNVSEIIVHSDSTKKELVENFNIIDSKINVIPHGLLLDNCDEKTTNEYVKRIYAENKLNGKLVFACLGAQSIYKGFDLVEKLWVENPSFHSNNQIHLIVAGKASNGLNYKSLESFSNVTLFDYFLSREEFDAVIRLADVVLLPYRKISQSGVLLSVLSKRKPVVVSKEGGLIDPFKCGNVGWIIGDASYDNLKKSMEEIIQNKSVVAQIANDNDVWEKINDMFSWGRIGELTLCLYKRYI